MQSCQMHWPVLHSVFVTQSCAEPCVVVVAGVHLPPVVETSSHREPAVPAIESATPQQTWLPGQSDSWTHLKVADVAGHAPVMAMQLPAPNWLMQQMLLLRSHEVPQMGMPASSNCTLLGTRPDPPLLVLPPESGCAPLDDVDEVDPEELVLDPESGMPLDDPEASSPKPPPLPPVPQADRPAVTIVPVTRNTAER
jgi:hypothetical protein